MGLTTAFLKAWRCQSRTDKSGFISQNLDYASAKAIAQHVEAYLFDILDEMDDPEYVSQWLRDKGYEVKKNNHGAGEMP